MGPGCGQVSMATTTQWAGLLVARERGKGGNVVRDVSGTGGGEGWSWRSPRAEGKGCLCPRGGLPEGERKGTETGRGGARAVIKGMRVWQSEACSSKTPPSPPPGPAQGIVSGRLEAGGLLH